jgi:D-glycero-alpha-D-manno-heptose-7-phosphate kinase
MKMSDINDFISNFHVYYLNEKRDASDILIEQKQLKNDSEKKLLQVKEYGFKTLDLIRAKDFDSYGLLLDEYWTLKKQLSNKISLSKVDEVYDEVKRSFGVLGGKIIGAGGGGFLLLYSSKNKKDLDDYMSSIGYRKLHFNMDEKGSIILGNF